jgi:hypothetical protein
MPCGLARRHSLESERASTLPGRTLLPERGLKIGVAFRHAAASFSFLSIHWSHVWIARQFDLSLEYVHRAYEQGQPLANERNGHLQQKYQNNRAENSHQPTRLREKVMRGFKSPGHAQRFLSAFGIISSHFRVGRHLYRASAYRAVMKLRFAVWEEAICLS